MIYLVVIVRPICIESRPSEALEQLIPTEFFCFIIPSSAAVLV